jgi:hypothetical protein
MPVIPLLAAALACASLAPAQDAPTPPPAQPTNASFRLPTWDLAWMRMAEAGSFGESSLTEREKGIAREIFGDSVDVGRVRLVWAKSPTGEPMTFGNVIRMPVGHDLSAGTIIHELAHVWQYQTRGSSYLSDSLLRQACAYLRYKDRGKAYDYRLEPGKSIFRYEAEQQAQIIEDFTVSKEKRTDPRYLALIAEVRATKAFRSSFDMLQENDGGLPPREQALPPGPEGTAPWDGSPALPLVEYRF